MTLSAQSRLVGADQVYTPRPAMAVYVVDVRNGWVVADIYDGTTRGQRVRLARAVFELLFTNYSFGGVPDETSPAVVGGGRCGPRDAVRDRLPGVDGGRAGVSS